MSVYPRLAGDIGGTRARFGLQTAPGRSIEGVTQYLCADFEGVEEAIHHYLDARSVQCVRAAAIGVATPVTADEIVMTNSPWRFSQARLRANLGLDRLAVINDFAAQALSLPHLTGDDLEALSHGTAVSHAPRIVVGPGTGLGLAALVGGAAGPRQVVAGEGGHCSLAPVTDEQADVLAYLRRQFDHVSAERVVSGQGLVNLYRAAAHLEGHRPNDFAPADVVAAASVSGDRASKRALRLFTEFLGGYVGSQALSFGARGGVYLTGGVLGHVKDQIDLELLLRHFTAKGRFATYLQSIPIWFIQTQHSALRGALAALD